MHKESAARKRVVYRVLTFLAATMKCKMLENVVAERSYSIRSIQLIRLVEKSHVALYRAGGIKKLTFKLNSGQRANEKRLK